MSVDGSELLASARRGRHPGLSWRTAAVTGTALFVVLVLAATAFDEQVSQALRSPEAGWALALEKYGQLPGVLVGLVAATILLRLWWPAHDALGWVGVVVVASLLLMSALQVALELGAHVAGHTDVCRTLGVGLPLAVLAVVVSRRLPLRWAESVRPAAEVALALPYVASLLTVWSLKIPWGRWTPRDITAAGDPTLFTPWYLPQGANGHFSFVSGHTSFAFVVIGIVMLVASTRRAFVVGAILCLTWGVGGALGRVVLGAHYPSDVLFAAALTIVWAVLLARFVGYEPPPQRPRAVPDDHAGPMPRAVPAHRRDDGWSAPGGRRDDRS